MVRLEITVLFTVENVYCSYLHLTLITVGHAKYDFGHHLLYLDSFVR